MSVSCLHWFGEKEGELVLSALVEVNGERWKVLIDQCAVVCGRGRSTGVLLSPAGTDAQAEGRLRPVL